MLKLRHILLALLALSGCDGKTPTTGAPSASVTASASAMTSAAASTAASAPKPYAGPTGTLTGVVRIKGAESPRTKFNYPKECRGAEATYGHLFRKGLDGELADALVAVHGYEGFVPPKDKAISVTIKDCAYSARTVAMTDGQHLEVKNLDGATSYIPHLDGARSAAVLVAVPKGDPVKLYSRGPMRYWLRDQMGRQFMVADVFHFRYSTTSVTGLDGRYRIEGIPVGKVKVSVLVPALNMKTFDKDKEFEIKKGENTFDLELEFDAKKDVPPEKGPQGGAKGSEGKAPESKSPPPPKL